jgi:DNA-binding transcriptional LysR family regulator
MDREDYPMDIQKLKYFYTTAKLEHITRASEVLHISQPSLTQAIHLLEEELGVPLFRRQGRRVVLTTFGIHLKKRLDTLLPDFDHLAVEMEQLRQTSTNTVKLNILAASSMIIQTIMLYKKQNPDAVFGFEQNEIASDCDILITTNDLNTNTVGDACHRFVKKEAIYLAVPKTSPYAQASAIDLSEVRNESFIMLSSTRLFGALCNRFCALAGFSPKIVFESDSPMAVQNIISMGAGISFWPEYSWGDLQNDHLTLLPIANPICQRDLILELHDRLPKSAYAADFYHFLLQTICP